MEGLTARLALRSTVIQREERTAFAGNTNESCDKTQVPTDRQRVAKEIHKKERGRQKER